MSVSDVAEVEGVSRQAVNNWKNTYEQEGMEGLEGLDAKPHKGGRSTPYSAPLKSKPLDYWITSLTSRLHRSVHRRTRIVRYSTFKTIHG